MKKRSAGFYSVATSFVFMFFFLLAATSAWAWTVSGTAVGRGTIVPPSKTVADGSYEFFEIIPNSNYQVSSVTGCGMSLYAGNLYRTGTITADCTFTATFTATATPSIVSGAGNGTISPDTPQTVPAGTTKSFTVSPNTGFQASVAGTCGTNGTSTSTTTFTYTTKPLLDNCSVEVTFTAVRTVTSSVKTGAGTGTIAPEGARLVVLNNTQTYTLTPAANHKIDPVTGTCPSGTLSGNSYTTGAITDNCTVEANFSKIMHKVTSSVGNGGNGTITPLGEQFIWQGTTTSFSLSPNAGHISTIGGTCPYGTLSGNNYTTGTITAECTVIATFVPQYTVTPSWAGNGTIDPPTPRTITANGTAQYNIIPAANHSASVGGTCGTSGQSYSTAPFTYTTNPVTQNCSVIATFSPITYLVTPSPGPNGTMTPMPEPPLTGIVVTQGSTTFFDITPSSGYVIDTVTGCSGTLDRSVTPARYTTGPINGHCTVTATFIVGYTVTPSAGANGSISPATPQLIGNNKTTSFNITPTSGYVIDTVTSDCDANGGGTLDTSVTPAKFTTVPITKNCAVQVSFKPAYKVTPAVGSGGTVTPATDQWVTPGLTTTFTVTPNTGYQLDSVGGDCPAGGFIGDQYTTGAITGNCTVSFTFVIRTYTVTPSVTGSGTISPSSPQSVQHGASVVFDVTPNIGYSIDTIGGTCQNGTLNTASTPYTYTVPNVTSNCTVVANFKANQYVPCPTGMVHYWKFDETSGTTFADSFGTSNATCTTCPTPTTGAVGGARQSTSSQNTVLSNSSSFNWAGNAAFSIEAWVKTNAGSTCSGNEVIFGRDDRTTNIQWWLGCLAGGQPFFYLGNNSGDTSVTSTKLINDGKWHHLAVVRNGVTNELSLYVDGELRQTVSKSFTGNFSATNAVNVGWLNYPASSGFRFLGSIDELAVYNTPLTASQVGSHYYLARGYCETCATPVRIMPGGDSITQGIIPGVLTDDTLMVSYRQKLYTDLTNAYYSIDFVGARNYGSLATPSFDFDNNGVPGYRIAGGSIGLKDNIYGWLQANPADAVLIHIGTNDFAGGDTASNMLSGMTTILNEIDRYSPNVPVVLARLINTKTPSAALTDFNTQLAALAQSRIANGDKIIMANMESALSYPGDMVDTYHPTQAGYDKMAGVWRTALEKFLPVCGPLAPKIASTPVTQAYTGEAYQYDVNAAGAPNPVYSLTSAPAWLSINRDTGLIQGTPPGNAAGDYSITVRAENIIGADTQTYTLRVVEAPYIVPKTGWTLVSVDSAQLNFEPHPGQDAFDGNTATFWHTRWDAPVLPLPHDIKIDMGGSYTLNGFRYLPRQDGGTNGRIGQFEFYMSADNVNWGSPVAAGTFPNTALEQEVSFNSATGRYIWLRAITEANGGVHTSVAEISVLAPSTHPAITSSPVTAAKINKWYRYTVTANGYPVPTFRLVTAPAWMTINTTTGLISGIAPALGRHTVTVEASNGRGLPATQTFIVEVFPTSPRLSKTGWTLKYVDSEQTEPVEGQPSQNQAVKAFDGINSTFWHTRFTPVNDPMPHEIQIDMGALRSVDSFIYLPRQDGGTNGRILEYEFYVSRDGVNWGSPVAKNVWAYVDALEKDVAHNPKVGRYIRLRALSSANGGPWTTMAELSVTAGNMFTITATSNGNGTITCTPQPVGEGETSVCTLTPDSGYQFKSLTDNGTDVTSSVTNNTYNVQTVNTNRTLVATFEVKKWAVTATKEGGCASCTISCETPVNQGSSSTCTINAGGTGYNLQLLRDDGTDVTSSVTGDKYATSTYQATNVASVRSIVATFAQNNYSLTVNKSGLGAGAVTGAGTYTHGTTATVTATPNTATSVFSGWSGDCTGTNPSTTVLMNGPKTCTATFTLKTNTLTVNTAGTGSGTVTGGGSYSLGSTATVTATPNATTSNFTGWSGDCTGTNLSTTVLMDGPKTCTATFALKQYAITTNTPTGGTISCSPASVAHGANTTCTMVASTGLHLETLTDNGTSVIGAVAGDRYATSTYQISNVTAAHTVNAGFTSNAFAITINQTGNGAVNCMSYNPGNPTGTACGTTAPGSAQCAVNYGGKVQCEELSPEQPGWKVFSYSGTGGGYLGFYAGYYTFDPVMSNGSFNVTYALKQYALNVAKAGNGEGTISLKVEPSGTPADITTPYTQQYDHGTQVTLTAAVNATSSTFTGWTGSAGSACASAGTTPQVTVNMTEARSCTATFTLKQYALNVTKAGNGEGTISLKVEPSGTPADITTPYSQQYNHYTQVTLNAAVNSTSSTFTGWTGSAGSACASAGTTPQVTVNMTEARSCTATFTYKTYTLITAVNSTGTGTPTVTKSPDQADYNHYTVVTLTPNPDASALFSNWTGDVPTGKETDNPLSVTMDGNRSITANFAIKTYTIGMTKEGNGTVCTPPASVNWDTNWSCTVTADANNHIIEITTNGTPQAFTPNTTTTQTINLNNIKANQTVHVKFAPNLYPVTTGTFNIPSDQGAGGTLTCSPSPAPHGSTVTCIATPTTSWIVLSANAYGEQYVSRENYPDNHKEYDFLNVTGNRKLDVTFMRINMWDITVTKTPADGSGGNVSCSPNPVLNGADSVCTVTPATGWHVQTVLANGTSVTLTDGKYTFMNVTGARTFSVTFEINSYQLTVDAAGDGTGTVSGQGAYNHGQTATVTASPAASSNFIGWSGACTGTELSTTVVMDGPKTCTATFNIKRFTITPDSSVLDGTITCDKTTNVPYGTSSVCSVTPDAGHHVTGVTIDAGQAVTLAADGTYTFSNIQGDHQISATCAADVYDIIGSAKATVIDFEGLADATTVNTQYQAAGVTFSGATSADCTVATCGDYPPASGQSLITNGGGTIGATFDALVTGNIHAVTAFVNAAGNVTMTAYDASNNLLGSSQTMGALYDGVEQNLFLAFQSATPIARVDITHAGGKFTVDDMSFFAAGGNGTVLCVANKAGYNGTSTCTLTAGTGYHLVSLYDNGTLVDLGASVTGDLYGTSSYAIANIDGSHIVLATFSINDYTLTVAKAGNGSGTLKLNDVAAPFGTTEHNHGDIVKLEAVPNAASSTFTGWGDDCLAQGANNPINVTMDQAKSCTATFTLIQRSLTLLTAGIGGGTGSVTPAPAAPYNHGDVVTLAATPTGGSIFENWTGDCSGSTNPTTVTMNGAKTCTANFRKTHEIAVTPTANGTVTPGTTAVPHGGSQGFVITPDTANGYEIKSIVVNGGTNIPVTTPNGQTFTFSNVTAPNSLNVTFGLRQYQITVTSSGQGTVTPGTTLVTHGTSQNFVVQPNPGYFIQSLKLDGVSQTITEPTATFFTSFTNVKEIHTLEANFAETFEITVTKTGNGTVTPGTTTVLKGSSQTFTISPAANNHIADVKVGESSVCTPTCPTSYTFPNVQANGALDVTFAINTHTVGGSVSGLNGTGLVLQNNLGDDLAISANGSFTFATAVAHGSNYSVTVKTQPTNPLQTCSVTNGAGTISGANVTNVSVTCSTNTYSVGGSVSGLNGTGLVLQNNAGDDLPVSANGTFTFATKIADLGGYAVTVKTQPTSPSQTCSVTNGSGTISGANVTNVQVTCGNVYALSVAASNGTVTKDPDQTIFTAGATVQLTATANEGYQFTGWSGSATGTTNPLTVTMNSDKNITANFASLCTWSDVDASNRQACVSNSAALKQCLKEAQADGKHNTIMVVQGTYKGNFVYGATENSNLGLHGGYVAGCGSFSYNPALTVIDGDVNSDGTGDGVALDLMVTVAGAGNITVDGFHVKKGRNTVNDGGGIRAYADQGSITVSGSIVSGNSAQASGGGVAVETVSGGILLVNNIVYGNSAVAGAGVGARTTSGAITILNNTMSDNTATGQGGGLAVELLSGAASADITNNIIWNNAPKAPATCGDIVIDSAFDKVTLRNNDFNQTTGICVTGFPSSIDPSNLSVDPQFVNAAGGDYHLAVTSPCRNQGLTGHTSQPQVDIDGEARLSQSVVDIGADEVPALVAPTLTSPSGSITIRTPVYAWTAVLGATQYRLYVTDINSAVVRDETFSSGAICSGSACTVPTATPLASEKKYFWTVRASNAAESTQWASTKNFFVTSIAPVGKAVLNAPKGLMSAAPTSYSWTAVDGATQYRLNVTDSNSAVIRDETFSAAAICSGSTCSVSAGALAPEKKYYWTVRGANTFGSGPWATTANFTITTASLPARPVLGSPTGVISSTTPSYSWPAVSGATDYILYVVSSTGVEQRNDMFSASSICSGGTCTVPTTTSLASEMKYYWTVRALNLAGFSPWASPKNFTVTSATIPGAPTPGAPSGAIGTTSPTYTWTVGASSGATKYQLYVTDSTWAVVRNQEFDASSICSGGTCTVPTTTPLGAGKTYSWKVRGANMAGYGEWTTNQTFTTP